MCIKNLKNYHIGFEMLDLALFFLDYFNLSLKYRLFSAVVQ